ncbi:hypothetical protein [Kitasatospora sp. NPDC057541]|uniref:hypothetical protein n=1 Tax=unclassified Kitasatospora TaxID=2633591 RepID=UPI0036998ED3
MSTIPTGAAKLAKAAEANGWTVTQTRSDAAGPDATYLVHAERGADRVSASWTRQRARWVPTGKASVRIGSRIAAATLTALADILTAPAQEQAPAEQAPAVPAVPADAAQLAATATAANWTVRIDTCGDDTRRVHVLTGGNGYGEEFQASWARTATTPWALDSSPAFHTDGQWRPCSVTELTTVIKGNPGEGPTPVEPAGIGDCLWHGDDAVTGVRLYSTPDADGWLTKRCGGCTTRITGRPATDLPYWRLTDDERATIVRAVHDQVTAARRAAATAWAGDMLWGHDIDIPAQFADEYARVSTIDPATAYVRWADEHGRRLTPAERTAFGLAPATWQCAACHTANPQGEEACTVCEAAHPADTTGHDAYPEADAETAQPSPLAHAQTTGTYTMKRVTTGTWHVTYRGQLYRVRRRPGRIAYVVHHLVAGLPAHRLGGTHGTFTSLTQAVNVLKHHADRLTEARYATV